MESTGKYRIPVYNILEATRSIVLAHPKYVKAIRGKKTDARDAKWIADIFKQIWFPAVISRPLIYGNFETLCVTGSS